MFCTAAPSKGSCVEKPVACRCEQFPLKAGGRSNGLSRTMAGGTPALPGDVTSIAQLCFDMERATSRLDRKLFRQRAEESCPLVLLSLYPHPASVSLNDSLNIGQADAGAFKFLHTVQPLKDLQIAWRRVSC